MVYLWTRQDIDLLAFSSALVIVLAVMFGKDEKGPKKYIEMN